MKRFQLLITLALAVAMIVASCQPENFGEVATPREVLTEMSGSWKLARVTQTDEDAVRKGFPYKTLDITSYYNFTTSKLTFNTGASGAPSSFTFDAGTAPPIIPIPNGTWSVDDLITPKVITFTSGATTSTIEMGSYALLDQGKLNLRITKLLAGKPVITYNYEFVR